MILNVQDVNKGFSIVVHGTHWEQLGTKNQILGSIACTHYIFLLLFLLYTVDLLELMVTFKNQIICVKCVLCINLLILQYKDVIGWLQLNHKYIYKNVLINQNKSKRRFQMKSM